jgi:uncharacterized protein (TIGR03437 family)
MTEIINRPQSLLRATLRVILLGSLFTAAAGTATSQNLGEWRQTTGPRGGNVTALIEDGANLFAGTVSGGVYRSADNGQTWTPARRGLSNRNVRALAVNGASLFAGTGNGVFRSTDQGQNWTAVNTGLPANPVITALAVSSTSLFAAVGTGVYRSSDNGQSWTGVFGAPATINSLAANGATIMVCNQPFVDDGGGAGTGDLAYSTNDGQTWTRRLVAGGASAIFVSGGVTFISNVSSGRNQLVFSADGGQTWRIYTFVFPSRITDVKAVGNDRFVGTASSGIFHLENDQWVEANTGLADRKVRALLVSGGSFVAGTDGGGIFRSVNNGQSWAGANLRAQTVTTLAVSGANILAGAEGGGLSRSDDSGQSWVAANSGLGSANVLALAVSGANIFAGVAPSPADGIAGGVFRSADNGQSWTAVNSGLLQPARGLALAVSGTNIFASLEVTNDVDFNRQGVFRSADQGQTWVRADAGLTSPVTALAASGANVFAATGGSLVNAADGLYRSADSGQSWAKVPGLHERARVTALAVSGANVFAVVLSSPANGIAGGVFHSGDNGQSWTAINQGLPANSLVYTLLTSGPNLFAGTSGGVYRSTDNGRTWVMVNAGLANPQASTQARVLAVRGTDLLAGMESGSVWLNANLLSTTVVVSASAASYTRDVLADESIVSAFGTGLAAATQAAAGVPLPTELAGTSVRVRDSAGVERLAPLFFVSPLQVNYQIPPGTALGLATVTITNSQGQIALGPVPITQVAPGLFAANADGRGVAAALVQRIKADGTRVYEEIVTPDAATGRFVARPIDLGPDGEQVFLELYGTGIRKRSALAAVQAAVGGAPMEVLYAGEAPGWVGLDQVNVRLARTLIGRGEVDLVLTVDGRQANRVTLNIR